MGTNGFVRTDIRCWAGSAAPAHGRRQQTRAMHDQREDVTMTRTFLKTLTAAALATVAITAVTSAAMAEALRDKWCSDVNIRFFVGGAEGDSFASIVYNGAV